MTTSHELRIEGMSCGHCVKTVEQALRGVPGVTRVEVEIGKAHVEAQGTVTRQALIAAVAEADYSAS
jgi:copper chaperone